MTSTFLCPLCKKPLQYCEGDEINPKNGITIWCEDCMDCGGMEQLKPRHLRYSSRSVDFGRNKRIKDYEQAKTILE